MPTSRLHWKHPSIVVGVLIVFSLIAWSCTLVPNDEVNQPIVYNHQVHIENAGLHCNDCHVHVETMASATLPKLVICRGCHDTEPVSESPEELVLLKYVADGKEIPWVKVYNVPDHVYFSHRRHVVGGELDCSACHGAINEMTKPVTSEYLPATMENCMACHRNNKVSNDCLSCHR